MIPQTATKNRNGSLIHRKVSSTIPLLLLSSSIPFFFRLRCNSWNGKDIVAKWRRLNVNMSDFVKNDDTSGTHPEIDITNQRQIPTALLQKNVPQLWKGEAIINTKATMSAPARNAKVLVPLRVIAPKLFDRHISIALRCTAPATWGKRLARSRFRKPFAHCYQCQNWLCRCFFFSVVIVVWIQHLFGYGEKADACNEA